jgi:Cytochrome P450
MARHPDVQDKLREELSPFSAIDPTWDQLTTSLPYLDAFVHEALRIHVLSLQKERVVSIGTFACIYYHAYAAYLRRQRKTI